MLAGGRVHRGLLAVVLTGSALTGSALPGLDATASARAQPVRDSAGPAAGGVTHHLTLVTGDTVTVMGDTVSATPGAGRRGISFSTYRGPDGHLHVVPSDAQALVNGGRLDRRLFDVTALAEYGYDSRRGDLPLIVRQAGKARSAARTAMTRGGAKVTRELAAIGGAAVRSRHATATAFWNEITTRSGPRRGLRPEIGSVWLDSPYRLSLDSSVPQVGAPAAWAAGFDGTGVKVAVLDSGIDTTHPDLADRVVAAQNFTTEPNTDDSYGHGTHVASIIAGSGAASGGAYRGVAPGVSLLNGKVCLSDGLCNESWILAGIEWAAQQGADVVNLSLGGPDAEGVGPLEEAVNTLTASHDILFVIAAGNSQGVAKDYSVSSPSTAEAALSVGAVDEADNLAYFSNRGPRVGDTALKPDITAPGVSIAAARSSTGQIGQPGEQYVDASGTSMSAPHVAGAAAILAQRRPGWSSTQLKGALMSSADPDPTVPTFHQGAGRLNIARGLVQTVLPDRPSISLGRQVWPHHDDPELTRTLTYTNTGTAAVTLNLSLATLDPNGSAAPAGMFAVAPTSLTLAAGASAPVTLTATTSVAGPDGFYGGHLTATAGGGLQVSTPFAVDRATEGYEVTVENIDRNGALATDYTTALYPLTPGNPVYMWGGVSGPVTTFVKKGTYLVQNFIQDSDAEGSRVSIMTHPRLEVTGNRSITFDARSAGQVDVGVSEDPLAQPYSVEVINQLIDGTDVVAGGTVVQDARVYVGQSDPGRSENGYTGKVVVTLARPGTDSTFRNSPRSYHLASFFEQTPPTGWVKNFTVAALGRVDASFARTVPGAFGAKGAFAFPGTGRYSLGVQAALFFDAPFTHAEYLSTGNVLWQPAFSEVDQAALLPLITFRGGLTSYVAGSTVSDSWNSPVLGPAHGMMAARPDRWVVRQGNTITADVKLLGDGAGHPGEPGLASSGELVLKRNGTVVGTRGYPPSGVPSFEVAGGYAAYQLEARVERGAPVELSNQVSAVWRFHSDTPGGTEPQRLPLWSISFRPTLNDANTATAGQTFTMPASLAAQTYSPVAGLATVAVQYSTDDGATWTDATVTGSGTARTITVRHPDITGFVSLKATAADYAGNSVEQTIIRAYRIAP